jgi:hypothetical protein
MGLLAPLIHNMLLGKFFKGFLKSGPKFALPYLFPATLTNGPSLGKELTC